MMESKFVDVLLNQNINNLQNEQFVTEQHEDEPEVRHVDPLEAELLESIDNSIKTWNIPPALLDALYFLCYPLSLPRPLGRSLADGVLLKVCILELKSDAALGKRKTWLPSSNK